MELPMMEDSESLLDMSLEIAEAAARNCTLRMEHINALNLTSNLSILQRLYNMCEHTWDPNKTWGVYYWEELIPPLIIYSFTLLLGVFGNLMILWAVLCFREMKSPTNLFLASLAFADLLLCILCLPVKLAELFSFSWTFGKLLCLFVNYMQSVSAIASVLNLTVMSLERCYAIVYPMKAKSVCTVSKAKTVLALVWISSFILAVPSIFIQEHVEVGLVQKVYWCVPRDSPPFAWKSHEVYLMVIILLIPGGFMSAAYGAIARKIYQCIAERKLLVASDGLRWAHNEQSHLATRRRVSTDRQSERASTASVRRLPDDRASIRAGKICDKKNCCRRSTNAKRPSSRGPTPVIARLHCHKVDHQLVNDTDHNVSKPPVCRFESRSREPAWIPISYGKRLQKQSLNKFRKAIRMLVVIVVVFVLCWTPYLTFNILQAFGLVDAQLHGFVKHLKTAFTLMAYLNSALNPIIYGFMCKSFRDNFYNTIRSSFLKNSRNPRRHNSDQMHRLRELRNFREDSQPAMGTQKGSQVRGDNNWEANGGADSMQRMSSCGCIQSSTSVNESPNRKNPIEGCGCVCGEGHRHFSRESGQKDFLICCNAHGLRVNRSWRRGC